MPFTVYTVFAPLLLPFLPLFKFEPHFWKPLPGTNCFRNSTNSIERRLFTLSSNATVPTKELELEQRTTSLKKRQKLNSGGGRFHFHFFFLVHPALDSFFPPTSGLHKLDFTSQCCGSSSTSCFTADGFRMFRIARDSTHKTLFLKSLANSHSARQTTPFESTH